MKHGKPVKEMAVRSYGMFCLVDSKTNEERQKCRSIFLCDECLKKIVNEELEARKKNKKKTFAPKKIKMHLTEKKLFVIQVVYKLLITLGFKDFRC